MRLASDWFFDWSVGHPRPEHHFYRLQTRERAGPALLIPFPDRVGCLQHGLRDEDDRTREHQRGGNRGFEKGQHKTIKS